jgi:hypothetical protein
MGMSREFAERCSDWANAGIILAAVLGVVSTGLAIWTGNVKEAYLKRDVAETNARGEEAKALAEGEKLARLKLEKELAWRSFSTEQAEYLTGRVKPFSGQLFSVITYIDDPEAVNFATTLVNLLVAAGWIFEKSNGFLAFQIEVGLQIETRPEKKDELAPAVLELFRALNDLGILASTGFREGTSKPNAITIRIGKKPERAAH